jgi:hypothetical protein
MLVCGRTVARKSEQDSSLASGYVSRYGLD